MLAALPDAVAALDRPRSRIEARLEWTLAYVTYIAATASARLGSTESGLIARARSTEVLDQGDPLHRWVARAYSARIEQGLCGVSRLVPLVGELGKELNLL